MGTGVTLAVTSFNSTLHTHSFFAADQAQAMMCYRLSDNWLTKVDFKMKFYFRLLSSV